MRISKRRADTELEGPFRTPEQLALAMPLVAMIGLMVVVSAVATGGSGPMVALVAVGGFGLCAVAPMALIDVYVTRPLRAALTHMRAARDGRASEAAFASGVVADLVHLARDIQAAHANLGPHGEALAQYEKMIANGEDALRALRQQGEDLADDDSRRERGARAEIAELAEAVRALRVAPAAGLDGAVERLEAMLVYLAESLERVEAKDRQIEGGVGEVERGIADLARLVARETETMQGALSSGGLGVRADIAAAVADEKIGRARVLERLDALETRLAAVRPGDARPVDDLRALVETVARHAKGLAPGAIVEALRPQLGGLAEAVSRLAEGASEAPGRIVETLRAEFQPIATALAARLEADGPADLGEVVAQRLSEAQGRWLDDVERGVVERIVASGRDQDAATLSALDRLRADMQALAAQRPAGLASEAVEPLGDRVDDAQAGMTGALAEMAARLEAALGVQAERFQAFENEALAPACRALDGAAQGFVAAQARLAQAAAQIEAGDPRLAEVAEMTGRVQTRLGELAAGAEGLASQLDAAALTPAREALTDAAQRFEAAQTRLADAAAQIEAGAPLLAAAPRDIQAQLSGFAETLRLRSDDLAPTREALTDATQRFEAAQTRLADAAAQIEAGAPLLAAAPHDIQAQLSGFAETLRSRSDDLAPAHEALTDATQRFEAAQTRLADVAAQIEAGAPLLAAAPRDIQAQLSGFAATLRSRPDDLAPAREALNQATQRLEAAETKLSHAAAQIEAGAPLLAAAPQDLAAKLSGFAETLRARSDDLASRIAVAALVPAREALAEAAQSFEAAQTKLSHAAAEIAAGDPRLAATAQAIGALAHILPEVSRDLGETQGRWRELVGDFETATQRLTARAETDARGIEALRADFGAAGDTAVAAFAARSDAEAEARAAAAQTGQAVAALSQAMGDLVATQNRIEAAVAQQPQAPALQRALDALRSDLAVTSAAAAERFDVAAQDLTRTVEDRVEMLRRGELWPAIAAAQAAAQDLNTAHAGLFSHVEALKAALIADRSGFAALRLDVVEAFATVAAIGERADAAMREVAASVADLGGVERAQLGAISQGLAKTGERVEYAARVMEDRRGGLDLPALAAELTQEIGALGRAAAERALRLENGVATLSEGAGATLEALRATAQALDVAGIAQQLEGFAQVQDGALRALESRIAVPAAVARLQDAMAQRGRSVVEAVEENTARLDALARLHDERLEGLERRWEEASAAPAAVAALAAAAASLEASAVELGGMREDLSQSSTQDAQGIAALRAELGLVGETVRAALDRFAGSLSVEARRGGEGDARPRTAAAEPKSSGAVAKLVVSMAEALDFRFSHIETALGELNERIQASQMGRDDDAVDAGLATLARDLNSASQALKAGLSDFVGASAALAQDVARAHGAEALTIAA